MRTLLRFGLGVCLLLLGFESVLLTLGGAPKKPCLIVGGSWVLIYLVYYCVGNHWYDIRNTGRSLITLVCLTIFTGVGWFAWYAQIAVTMFYVAVGIACLVFLAFFFAGGGAYLPGGSMDREAMRDASLIGISNALDDIKKKL